MDRRRGSPPPRGRGPPPPPPDSYRDPRGGDPFDRDFGRRRGRSPSPVYDRYSRRNSPPPGYKRPRRDDPYDRDRYGRDVSPPYGGRRGSPTYRDDDRRLPYDDNGSREREPADKPGRLMTFREFMLQQPDDLSPEDAQARYKQYKVEFHGGEIKAEFIEKKNDDATRAAFDPRAWEKVLLKRNEEAAESAKQFASDLEAGKMDASAEGFNQGMFEQAPPLPQPAQPKQGQAAAGGEAGEAGAAEAGAGGDAEMADAGAREEGKGKSEEGSKAAFAPAVCWRPSRVAVDLALAKKLVRKLDEEKGIQGNTLLPLLAGATAHARGEAGGAGKAAEGGDKQEGDGEGEGRDKEGEGGEQAAASGAASGLASAASTGVEGAPAAAAGSDGAQADEPEEVDEGNVAEALGRLDVLLTYLWRVHGLDYYAGYELTASEFPQRLSTPRILRGAPPAADAPVDEAEEKRLLDVVNKTVNEALTKRLQEGDPLEAKCQRKKVEELIDKWVEDQVVQHGDTKWGNKLSNKMFVAKKFVLKHVRSKHDDKLQAEKERILDEIYFENFKAFHEEEARAMEVQEDVEGGPRGGRGGRGGRSGRGPAGRGGRGAMMAGGRGGMIPVMDMGGMMPMGGPMVMPMGGMGPMIMIPAGMGPMGPIMAPMMAMGGGRGMPRGGGRFGGLAGPRGGGRMGGGRGMMVLPGGGGREYYDLDNPQNNRAVLDYGDL